MAALTTIAAVQKIVEYDIVLIPDLTPFIDTASALVNEVVASKSPVPSDEILEIVARYVTAHLVKITDKEIASEQVKSLQQSFQYRLSDGLGITMFGATAMMLDTSGRLSKWNKQVVEGTSTVQFFWVGSTN